ncbi:TetR family transcriptional regulator [Paenibacillus swuensis]|uniref:TetR family transcriptional regulator n=1 Tax=Paenibacillus swuensis TaxID=1178515 RepID=A0A172THX0_9BACL|nr:TetR/AcrR family transcriptional regulator [Paenibacillus swuensis]ANE46556.1 TetR family transcriptional regulator [Paenibacillus swuensis]
MIKIDKRELIIEQAVALFGELGYYKTTTAQVARAAGVTQPYIFHFFANKEELFKAVLDRAVMRLAEAFSQVDGSADLIIQNMGRSFQAIMESHRNEILMVMQAHAIAEEQIRDYMSTIYRNIHRTISAKFQDAGISRPEEEATRFMAKGQFHVVAEVLHLDELMVHTKKD